MTFIRSFALINCLLLLLMNSAYGLNDVTSMEQTVSAKLRANTLVSGNFEQTKLLTGFPHPISSTGSFIYWRNHGLFWQTSQPFPHATTFAQEGTIQWKNGVEYKSTLSGQSIFQKHISRILLSIFEGSLTALESYFEITWHATSASTWSAQLEPSHIAVKKTIDYIELTGGGFLTSLHIHASNGDKTLIKLNSIAIIDSLSQEQCKKFSVQNHSLCQ